VPLLTESPSAARLLDLVARMPAQPVVLLADLVADRFITGTPKRISREAPVLILRQDQDITVPGGGANAAANVAALEGRALVLGAVGPDPAGQALLGELRHRGADVDRVISVPGYQTPTKTRVLGGGRHSIKQQIVRFDVEDELASSPNITAALVAGGGLPPQAVAIASDYGYGAATPAHVRALRELLPGSIILCDSRFRLGEFVGIDAATPNEEETEELLGGPLGAEPAARCLELRDRLGLRFLLVTRGSAGMLLTFDQHVAAIPVHGTDEVADVTGAGDTVIATFALSLAAGATPLEAALLANYAGGIVVMKRGTATLTRGELTAAISRDARPLEDLQWVR
jgi:rfaE bifunctional protein kinase chain/domain